MAIVFVAHTIMALVVPNNLCKFNLLVASLQCSNGTRFVDGLNVTQTMVAVIALGGFAML
jgi:hypothetical protein